MDELFLLPPCPVAMPRAYWLGPKYHVLSSQVILTQPSKIEFERIEKAIADAGPSEYDMEIVNKLYGDSCMILPHRPYDFITRVLRENLSTSYLGNDVEEWDPDAVIKEAKFVHFSDWPVPKPWVSNPNRVNELEPSVYCGEGITCREYQLWLDIYSEFAQKREVALSPSPLLEGKADNSRKFVASAFHRLEFGV